MLESTIYSWRTESSGT